MYNPIETIFLTPPPHLFHYNNENTCLWSVFYKVRRKYENKRNYTKWQKFPFILVLKRIGLVQFITTKLSPLVLYLQFSTSLVFFLANCKHPICQLTHKSDVSLLYIFKKNWFLLILWFKKEHFCERQQPSSIFITSKPMKGV